MKIVPIKMQERVRDRAGEERRRNMGSLSKLPPLSLASSTASVRSALAFVGTCERKPMRGGSSDGCVKLP